NGPLRYLPRLRRSDLGRSARSASARQDRGIFLSRVRAISLLADLLRWSRRPRWRSHQGGERSRSAGLRRVPSLSARLLEAAPHAGRLAPGRYAKSRAAFRADDPDAGWERSAGLDRSRARGPGSPNQARNLESASRARAALSAGLGC